MVVEVKGEGLGGEVDRYKILVIAAFSKMAAMIFRAPPQCVQAHSTRFDPPDSGYFSPQSHIQRGL